jgi:hypothetical protein
MPRACRGVEHLYAGVNIHGEVGQRISHLVAGTNVVGPVTHIKLVREPAGEGWRSWEAYCRAVDGR